MAAEPLTAPAPPPDQQAQQQQQPDQLPLLAAVTLVLLSGLPAAAMAGYLAAILEPLHIPAGDVQAITSLVQPRLHAPLLTAGGPAEAWTNRTSYANTAAYLVNAAKRLRDGGTIDQERLYLSQHVAARSARLDSARQVDQAAHIHGPVVGWHAKLDASTTPACFRAHGHNFTAARSPALGWPGSLHGGTCRCTVGPPFPDAGSVDDAVASLPAGTV